MVFGATSGCVDLASEAARGDCRRRRIGRGHRRLRRRGRLGRRGRRPAADAVAGAAAGGGGRGAIGVAAGGTASAVAAPGAATAPARTSWPRSRRRWARARNLRRAKVRLRRLDRRRRRGGWVRHRGRRQDQRGALRQRGRRPREHGKHRGGDGDLMPPPPRPMPAARWPRRPPRPGRAGRPRRRGDSATKSIPARGRLLDRVEGAAAHDDRRDDRDLDDHHAARSSALSKIAGAGVAVEPAEEQVVGVGLGQRPSRRGASGCRRRRP